MSIKENILADLKEAMKSKDKARLQVLRSLKSKILEKEIAERKEGKSELTDEQVSDVLMKAAKQRKDSIDQYESGNRGDLAASEKQELEIIESYLPDQMSEKEIRDLVKETIDSVGASGPSDMGKVMGAIMPKVKGKADGNTVNRVVSEQLKGQ